MLLVSYLAESCPSAMRTISAVAPVLTGLQLMISAFNLFLRIPAAAPYLNTNPQIAIPITTRVEKVQFMYQSMYLKPDGSTSSPAFSVFMAIPN